jgi:peptidoglycan hydrolase CwlO-like protein
MSDATGATPPPQHQPAGVAPAASGPAASTGGDDAAKTKRLNNAVAFLRNPQVRASALARRVNFLKTKGMPADEIVEAFNRVGQPQTLEAINDILSGKTAASTTAPPPLLAAPPAASAAPSAAAPQAAYQPPQPHVYHGAPPPLPPHAPTAYYHPAPPPPLPAGPPPPAPWGWKDYFIGATVATVATATAAKAFTTFSPYAIVRKDRIAAEQQLQQQQQNNTALQMQLQQQAQQFQQLQQQRSFAGPASGGFRTGMQPSQMTIMESGVFSPPDVSTTVVPSVASAPVSSPAVALPPPPTPAPTATPTAGAKDDEIAKLKESLETAEKDLKQTQADLEKVRREKADMAVNMAKLKGQINILQRTAEKSEQQIEAKVQERLQAAQAGNQQAAAQAKPEAGDESALLEAVKAATVPGGSSMAGEVVVPEAATAAAAA